MANDKEYQLHTCYHCGNTGLLKIEHCCSETFGGPVLDDFGNEIDFELVEAFKWSMLSCPVCHMITLREEYTNDCYHGFEPEISTLYPEGLEAAPRRFAICKRNEWMVKEADIVITYVKGTSGGAARYKEFARRKQKQIIEISE